MRRPEYSLPATLALLAATLALCLSACTQASDPAPVASAKTAEKGSQAPMTYSMEDFARVPKYDAHVHANTDDHALIDQAKADGFALMSINVDYPDFPPIAEQRAIAERLAKAEPQRFFWAATFGMQGWGKPDWASKTDAAITDAVAAGARAVKIWKNVGMIEKDAAGKLIMLDDAGFDPIIARIQALHVPLIGHQGEPHNCWLPLDQMTSNNDREYFKAHPQYHMFLHPDQPSYEDQMGARDRFLARHPDLPFVGAHMASLEWSVDRLAKYFDANPHAVADMAARMGQIQYQSVRDHAKVRDFFIRYQDRILYATDLTHAPGSNAQEFRKEAENVWKNDWKYLATDGTQRVDIINADVKGLALPRAVIDKIYYTNAMRVFGGAQPQTR